MTQKTINPSSHPTLFDVDIPGMLGKYSCAVLYLSMSNFLPLETCTCCDVGTRLNRLLLTLGCSERTMAMLALLRPSSSSHSTCGSNLASTSRWRMPGWLLITFTICKGFITKQTATQPASQETSGYDDTPIQQPSKLSEGGSQAARQPGGQAVHSPGSERNADNA